MKSLTIKTKDQAFTKSMEDQDCDKRFEQFITELLGEKPIEKNTTEGQKTAHSLPTSTYEYRGFLVVKCERCGAIRAFCSKTLIGKFIYGNCGHETPFLPNMARVDVICKCGNHATYQTNITDDHFDIPCVACGSPIDVEYNYKEKQYQSMGRS